MKEPAGSEKNLHFSKIHYLGFLKTTLCGIWVFIIGLIFTWLLFSGEAKTVKEWLLALFSLFLGVMFIGYGVPYFAKISYVQWVQIRYLRACASGNEEIIKARTEPTIRALLRIKEWLLVFPSQRVCSLPVHDLLRADGPTLVLALHRDLLKKRNIHQNNEIKTSSLVLGVERMDSVKAVRFVTFVGYAEFTKEEVLQALKKYVKTSDQQALKI